MIAQRFRPLGWVAGVATAATGLYLVSLQVAAERGKLEAVERQIDDAQHQLFQLQTELGTRASFRQLEAWNGEVLDLTAPKADQFVKNAAQLTALDRRLPAATATPQVALLADAMAPPPAVDSPPAPEVLPKPAPVARATPSVPVTKSALAKPEKPKAPAAASATARLAAAKPPKSAAKPTGSQRVAMLDSRTIGALSRVASAERRTRP